MNINNFFKAFLNILTGNSLGSQLYDKRYPPSKFFKFNQKKINIECILSGYPRSGTNWIRMVVEKSSGQKTGNLGGLKPTTDDENLILLKAHARSKFIARAKTLWLLPAHNFRGKYIYSYRDPRDSIISLYEMYKDMKNLSTLSYKEFLDLYDPIGQYRWEIGSWVLPKHNNVLLVRFEDLKHDPEVGFQKIFDFLNLTCPISKEFMVKVVNVHDTKSRPRATIQGWKHAPEEYKPLIDTISEQLKKEISLLSYDK